MEYLFCFRLFNKLLGTCFLLMFMWGFPLSVHNTDMWPQPGSSVVPWAEMRVCCHWGGCWQLPSFSLRDNCALASHVYRVVPA